MTDVDKPAGSRPNLTDRLLDWLPKWPWLSKAVAWLHRPMTPLRLEPWQTVVALVALSASLVPAIGATRDSRSLAPTDREVAQTVIDPGSVAPRAGINLDDDGTYAVTADEAWAFRLDVEQKTADGDFEEIGTSYVASLREVDAANPILRDSVSDYYNGTSLFIWLFTIAGGTLLLDAVISFFYRRIDDRYGFRWFNLIIGGCLIGLTWFDTVNHKEAHKWFAVGFFALFLAVMIYTAVLGLSGYRYIVGPPGLIAHLPEDEQLDPPAGATASDHALFKQWENEPVAKLAGENLKVAREQLTLARSRVGREYSFAVVNAILSLAALVSLGSWAIPGEIITFYFFELHVLVTFSLFHVIQAFSPFPYRRYQFRRSSINERFQLAGGIVPAMPRYVTWIDMAALRAEIEEQEFTSS